MHIVLALDGSSSSLEARDLVAGLPLAAGTMIHVVSAYTVSIDWTRATGSAMPWVGDAEDAIRDDLRDELEWLSEPLTERGWDVQRRLVRGRPATAILDAAREFDVDLIVMGSRGRGPLRSMVLGSVSAEVVEHAPCSVLVARGSTVKRMLVATDGSDGARAIVDILGTWDVFRGVAAECISVAPHPERTFELVAGIQSMGTFDVSETRQVLDRYREFAEGAAAELAARAIPATSTVVVGDPADQIIDAARGRVDLIVTGSRGLHGLERVVLGSVARNVLLHARSSVLVVRRHAAAHAVDRELREVASRRVA